MGRDFLVDALGERLRIAADGMPESDVDVLRSQWSRLSAEGDAEHTLTVAYAQHAGADVTGRDLDEVSVALRRAVNQRAIEATTGELVALHAAGLADPETGGVIALIGPSGAGKSTAAATLGTALGYVSDETVAVAPSGEVIAFPQPLAFKPPAGRGKRVEGPDALGLRSPGARLRLSRVALLERSDAVTAPEVVTVGLGEVVAQVVEQVNYFASLPQPLTALDRIVRRCGGIQVIRYRDAADLVEPVRELLRTGADSGAAYARIGVDDRISLDGELVVVAHDRVSRLTPISSFVWGLLDVPLTLSPLVAAVEREFGPAPDGSSADAVRGVLRELTEAGLVRVLRAARHRALD